MAIQRIRRSRPGAAAAVVDRTSDIEDLMKSIATSQSMIAQHSANLTRWHQELLGLMQAQGMAQHQVLDITAAVSTPMGNASNVVDPRGFRRLVKDDDEFFSAISVSLTAAKKVLPEKQLVKITTHTPGKEKDPIVTVTRGDGKAKRGPARG